MSRDDRITPAGAGKTNHIIQTATIAADHPRRCGENGAHARRWCCEMGSPPQVRGKLNHAALTDSNAWDHPRRCGENQNQSSAISPLSGSPPQVRGKPGIGESFSGGSGITPAGAGKTDAVYGKYLYVEDHPRRCGENLHPVFVSLCATGITPAGAGKTRKHFAHNVQRQDHPRRCGENASLQSSALSTVGSPPQVRGKRCSSHPRSQCWWITPAGAGKTY